MADLGKLAGPDGGDESRRLAAFWKNQIKEVGDSVAYKNWYERGEKVEARYRDERNTTRDTTRRYNALWSNLQILQPALYGCCPVPICERRFRDKDIVGRNAATMLERGLRNEIEINSFHDSVSRAVLDYLLSGRGVVWVRYEPIISRGPSLDLTPETDLADEKGDIRSDTEEDKGDEKEAVDEEGDETSDEEGIEDAGGKDEEVHDEKLEETDSRVLRESCPIDYVPWRDFFTLPARARTESEVTAKSKRVYLSRDQAKRRFGKKIGEALPFQRDDRATVAKTGVESGQPGDESDKVEIFEIWSKQDSHVYWVAEGYDYLCDEIDDPLSLDGFYPCPPALLANPTNSTLVPVPDYIQYQDQAIQIDELTQRINLLAKACKVAGVYNSAATAIKRLFQEGMENELIAVDDWAAFGGDKGGVEGNISFIPLKEIMGVLQELMQIKQVQIDEMDRLTGINDILRGTTDARETLGAQRLKTNNTGTRLSARQDRVAQFCRDTVRIMADIMCKHFSPQSLIEVGGALYNEGLAPSDMPPLTQLLSMVTTGLNMPGGVSGVTSPTALPSPGMPGMAPPGMGGAPLALPPPGGAPTGMPGMPSVPPGMPPGMPGSPGMQSPSGMPGMMPGMAQPQLPDDVVAKLKSVQRIVQAIALLRDEKLLGFRVDIEVDSTIYGDSEQDKKDRTEFLRAVTDYMQQALLMGQQMPEITPLTMKFLQFGVRGFKVGRDLESAIEEVAEDLPALIQKRMHLAQQNPPPEMIKAQAQMITAQTGTKDVESKHQVAFLQAQANIASAQQKAQSDKDKTQAEVARQAVETEGERQGRALDIAKAHSDLQQSQVEAASDAQQSEIDKQIKLIELKIKYMEMEDARKERKADFAMRQTDLALAPHETAQTHAQVGVEHGKALQSGFEAQTAAHEARGVAHEVPLEHARAKTAAVTGHYAVQAAKHRPKPSSGGGGGGNNANS